MKTEEEIRSDLAKIEKALEESGIYPHNLKDQSVLDQHIYIRRIAAIDYLKDVLQESGIPFDELLS